jgi:hypothetical protein
MIFASCPQKNDLHDEDELMRRSTLSMSLPLVAWLVLGTHLGGDCAETDVSPAVELLTQGALERGEHAAGPVSASSPGHEALGAPGKDSKPERSDRSPPLAIVERPGAATPSPNAQWIGGYWTWNESRRDFDWVTGVWHVAPAGKFWVSGYWRRDPTGWWRVPGFWSEGRAAAPAPGHDAPAVPPELGRTRPLLPERPREFIGPPPGPGYFYVPGEYVPQGPQLVWKPGFWYPSQPGWEWIPAHWVRQASGWAFREGYWNPLARTPSQPPGSTSGPAGSPIVASAGSGKPEVDAAANEASGAEFSPDANGNGTTENDTPAAEKKPSESAARTPPFVRYPPQPTYYNPWGGMQWNGRATFGGVLNRFLSY